MTLNPNIILAGRQPDMVNVLARSTQAAGLANANQQQQRVNQLYQQQGPGILAGDPTALNALAQVDPRMALQVQQFGQQQERQDRRDQVFEQEFQLKLHEFARRATAEEKAEAAAEAERVVTRAGALFQAGDLDGINRELAAIDEDPIQSLDQFPIIAGMYGQALEVLKDSQEINAGPEPADEYGRYVAEETAAGRTPLSRIDYAQAKKGKGTVVFDPQTGRPLVSIGGGKDDPTDVTSPASPAAMIGSIDGILNDPALDFATGWLEWTQKIPGTGAKRFGARVKQLSGQAFLQAFESLKGGGHITEIEGQKATEAIGRLDTAQDPEDYRDALTELKGILQKGIERKTGGGAQPKRLKYNIETGAFE